MKEEALNCLRVSVQEQGVIYPIVVAPDGGVIEGHRRKGIADELGVTYETIVRDNIPEKQRLLASIVIEGENRRATQAGEELYRHVRRLHHKAGFSRADVASALGVSMEYVRTALDGPLEVRTAARAASRKRMRDKKEIAEAQARAVPEMPAPHAVMEFIPEIPDNAYEALKASIALEGQKVPIKITTNGLLVDGRARWRICIELGLEPITETVGHANPWSVSMRENTKRLANDWERMTVFAKLPLKRGSAAPTSEICAADLHVEHSRARTFREIYMGGEETQPIIKALVEGLIRLGTARRIYRETSPEDRMETLAEEIERNTSGAGPALPMDPALRGAATGPTIGPAQLRKIDDQLSALGMVLDGSGGLDPSITGEQAALWLSRLSTQRRHIGRLTTMLKKRKEAT